MLHPATAHFAIVLPVVATVFGLLYLIKRNESLSPLSARVTVVAAIAMIVAWYTGSQAGPEIYDYLSSDGQHELQEHATLGLYLAIFFGFTALLQFAGCQMKKFMLEALAIILIFAGTVTAFIQGKEGGEIVYNHGQPFKAYMIQDSLNEAKESAADEEACEEKLDLYESALEDIDSMSSEIQAIYGEAETEESE